MRLRIAADDWFAVLLGFQLFYRIGARQHSRREHMYTPSKDTRKESDSASLDDLIYSIEQSSIPRLLPAVAETTTEEPHDDLEEMEEEESPNLPGARLKIM
ncbi:unnamed protein product [Cylicocyclus nassatus]|uniref:Uncharacterized protein n=1 Tax=Cylicocyclus nassatus TaxID=53992 RepID=A0AA36GJB4_CYLNA|nr:unnamed protein product [Cylicocyclus nassatus]